MGSEKLYVAIQSTAPHTYRPEIVILAISLYHLHHNRSLSYHHRQKQRQYTEHTHTQIRTFSDDFFTVCSNQNKGHSLDYGSLESLDWHSINAQSGYLCEIIVNIIY